MAPDALPDPIAAAVSFASLLDRLGIPYVIGGSFASSVHGEPRSTNDIDIVADMNDGHVAALAAAVGTDFYVSDEAMREAVRTDGSFNILHVHGGMKIDVFVAGRDAFNAERLRHRETIHPLANRAAALYIDTAEHSILQKLEWFRRGGEVSERQWRDVVGIIRVQRERLDLQRLHDWAGRLGVSGLLERALAGNEG